MTSKAQYSPLTLGELHKSASTAISMISDTARLDAELIIRSVLNIPHSAFFTEAQTVVSLAQFEQIQHLIARRKQHYPVAYLTGTRGFWDLELFVSEATLIPRPETELLVETALSLFAQQNALRMLDLGTGSGAIAMAIAKARPQWDIIATDVSATAIDIAMKNKSLYDLQNVTLIHSNWFEAIHAHNRFELIISNPPYIAENDPHLNQGDVAHEPHSALCAGPDGLDDIRKIIPQAKSFLNTNGWLWLEHGYDQADAVKQLLTDHQYHHVTQHRDLAGHIRISGGQLG